MRTWDRSRDHRWAIVLAAGDGTRLQRLTRDPDGRPVPKQYCSVRGGRSLLELARRRAAVHAASHRCMVVVAEGHRPWWQRELAGAPAESVVVQPANRGTAAGILLPLLAILDRDREAVVAVLPSDHWVEREGYLARALRRAYEEVEARPEKVVLLGMVPEEADPDLGWIVPVAGGQGPLAVARFREKPGTEETVRLRAAGALISSFLFVARGQRLLEIFESVVPEVAGAFASWRGGGGSAVDLATLYEGLPHRDFSRDVLERACEHLAVVAVPACGWSDLGTPERVARCLARGEERGRASEPPLGVVTATPMGRRPCRPFASGTPCQRLAR